MIEQLELEHELELIYRVREGDNVAAETLLKQYLPALKAAQRKAIALDKSEAESATQAAFIEAIWRFDEAKHTRLAGAIKSALLQEVDHETKTKQAFTVPARSLSRYWKILREADNDPSLAADIAEQFGMMRSTWLSINDNVTSTYLPESEGDTDPVYHSLYPERDQPSDFQMATLQRVFERLGDDNDLTDLEMQTLLVHYGVTGINGDKDYEQTAYELGIPKKEAISQCLSGIRKARKRLNVNQ